MARHGQATSTIICRSVRGYQASYKYRPKIGVLNRLDIDAVESNTAGSLIFNTQKVVDFLNLVVQVLMQLSRQDLLIFNTQKIIDF